MSHNNKPLLIAVTVFVAMLVLVSVFLLTRGGDDETAPVNNDASPQSEQGAPPNDSQQSQGINRSTPSLPPEIENFIAAEGFVCESKTVSDVSNNFGSPEATAAIIKRLNETGIAEAALMHCRRDVVQNEEDITSEYAFEVIISWSQNVKKHVEIIQGYNCETQNYSPAEGHVSVLSIGELYYYGWLDEDTEVLAALFDENGIAYERQQIGRECPAGN